MLSSAALLGACGSSASSSSTNASATAPAGGSTQGYGITVGYIGTAGILTGPEGFALQQGKLLGWLKPAGITSVKPAGFANGPLLTAALTGGSVDVGIVGDTPALIARANGIQAQLINQDLVGNGAWIVAQKGTTSLSQLSGQSVAVQQASYIDRYLEGILAQNNLSGKPKIVAMLQAQSIPAFESGSLKAVALPAYEGAAEAAKGYPVLAKSESTPSLQGTSLTIAPDGVLSAHPGLAAAWNAARVKSIAYAKANPSAYYAFMAKAEGTSVASAKQFLPISDYPVPDYTTAGIKQLQGTLNFLVSSKLAPKSFSIPGWEYKG